MLRTQLSVGPIVFHINWIVALAILIAATALLRLGFWQLERAGEKMAIHAKYQAMQNDSPIPIEGIVPSERVVDRVYLQNRQVQLRGTYLNDRSLFMIYQTFEDQIGYEIITPFQLASRDELVLVSRGWTGAADYETLRASLPSVTGTVELAAQLYVPREAEVSKAETIKNLRWPLLLRHLNLEQLQGHFDSRLFPYLVRLNEGQPGVLVRHWGLAQVDTGRNFSYALQWFAMALALMLASALLSSNVLALMRARAEQLRGPNP